MRAAVPVRPDPVPSEPASSAQSPIRGTGRWGLLLATAVALAVNSWHLSRDQLGNTFYAAGARSMAGSWHNFFFNSFDPGGFITVDKPPVAQWVGAISVHLFGFNSWSLLLPSAIAGALSVAVLWCIVARWFGPAAATAAGLVLAFTPIAVSVNRINLPEPFMILALLVAGWAVLRSLDSSRSWVWLVAAGMAVGVAFNTKMLAGFIPVPALGLVVLLCSAGSFLRKVAHAAVFSVASLLASLPWLLIVDAVNKAHRPYVGGSTNDTVWNLVFGYNGFARIDGNGQGGPGGGRGGGGFGGPGGIIAGSPGWGRMFSSALGGQIAWLIPLSVAGLIAAAWCFRRDRVQRAAVGLFAGWLLLFGVVFSTAQGTFHAYYTSAMAPGIAALVGIGGVALYRLLATHPAWWALAAAGFGSTFALERLLTDRFPGYFGWTTSAALAVLLMGVAAVAFSLAVEPTARLRLVGSALAIALAGTLIAPAAWSISQTQVAAVNTTLPQAGPNVGGAASRSFGSGGAGSSAPLAAWLKAHHTTERWDLVVSSAMQASSLIAYQNVSVMALGGFLGADPAATVSSFATMVSKGQLRYVQGGGGFGGFGGFGGGLPPGFNPGGNGTGTNPFAGQNPGAPPAGFTLPPGFNPGGGRPGGGGFGGGFAGSQGTSQKILAAVAKACPRVTSTTADPLPTGAGQLYDCAGKGAALAALAN